MLRPGGLVAVAVPSRHDSPELAHALPRGPLTFDAELAPGILAKLFGEVELEHWDAPLLELPSREAVRRYWSARASSRSRPRPSPRGPISRCRSPSVAHSRSPERRSRRFFAARTFSLGDSGRPRWFIGQTVLDPGPNRAVMVAPSGPDIPCPCRSRRSCSTGSWAARTSATVVRPFGRGGSSQSNRHRFARRRCSLGPSLGSAPSSEHEAEGNQVEGDRLGRATLGHAGVLNGVGVDGQLMDAGVRRLVVLPGEHLAAERPASGRRTEVRVRRPSRWGRINPHPGQLVALERSLRDTVPPRVLRPRG